MALKKKKKRVIKKRVSKKRPCQRAKPKKKALKRPKKAALKPKEKVLGTVTHYFPKVKAGVIKLKAPLAIGDAIKIKGHTTDFTQTVTSMQIDRVPISKANKGEEIGLLVSSRVRRNDLVYKA